MEPKVLATLHQLPGTCHQTPDTWSLAFGVWLLAFGTYLLLENRYLRLGAKNFLSSTWHPAPGVWLLLNCTWYLTLNTWHLATRSRRYLAPSACEFFTCKCTSPCPVCWRRSLEASISVWNLRQLAWLETRVSSGMGSTPCFGCKSIWPDRPLIFMF